MVEMSDIETSKFQGIPEGEKILFICAHPDDETFAAGAFLHRLSKEGNDITCVYFTTSPAGVVRDISVEEKIAIRKKEAEKACKILGTKPLFLDMDKSRLNKCLNNHCAEVEQVFLKFRPSIVFIPSGEEAHPTHKMTNEVSLEVIENLRNAIPLKEVWEYEIWTPLKKPNFIYFFKEDEMEVKIKAFKSYKSQIERVDFIDAMIGLSLYRGILGEEVLKGFGKPYFVKKRYGEAFMRNTRKDKVGPIS